MARQWSNTQGFEKQHRIIMGNFRDYGIFQESTGDFRSQGRGPPASLYRSREGQGIFPELPRFPGANRSAERLDGFAKAFFVSRVHSKMGLPGTEIQPRLP